MTSNVLVIGSNSFAASHFINYILDKKCDVTGISRSNSKSNGFIFKKLDLNKNTDEIIKLIKDSSFDAVFNFAAESTVQTSWLNPTLWLQTNALSPMKIVHECQYDIKRFIQMSTPEVYGNIVGEESFMYKPSTPYAVSKAAFDMYTKCMYDNNKFPIIYTRTSNWYGPSQQEYKIIPVTILKILRREKLKLDGGGESYRNFIYVDDVSAALYKVMKMGKIGSVYHIASEEYISIKELVKKICSLMDYDYSDLVEIVGERLGKDKHYKLHCNKIKKELKWYPKVSLEEGLEMTIDWYKRN